MKSIETQVAERNVDESLANFEQAVNQLIDKVDHTVTEVVETVNRPIELARSISAKGKAQALELRERIRRNPEPYVSWSLLAVGLLLCFRAVRNHRRSQLEP